MYDQQSAQELKYLCAHTTSQIECGKNVAHMCKEVFVYVQIVEEGSRISGKASKGVGLAVGICTQLLGPSTDQG